MCESSAVSAFVQLSCIFIRLTIVYRNTCASLARANTQKKNLVSKYLCFISSEEKTVKQTIFESKGG